MNRGVFSLPSFLSYVFVGALILPFSVLPDWIGNTKPEDYTELTVGMVGAVVVIAALANGLQVILRKTFLRKTFRAKLQNALPQTAATR